MKIEEFYSSGVKENGKIDIFLKCDNDKEYRFWNCEIYGDKDDLNPNFANFFVPYDYHIEDNETLGNHQKAIWDEITSYPIPPYSLTVDKDKVPEMNLAPPDKDKLYYIEFR